MKDSTGHDLPRRSRRFLRGSAPLGALAALSFGAAILVFPAPSEPPAPDAVIKVSVTESALKDVGRPKCRPGDRPETGLQGQVPVPDRLSGAAAEGYICNLTEIGSWGSRADDPTHRKLSGWANFDTYRHCAYFHDGNDGPDGDGGTVVMDVSDPSKPKQTDYLTTAAMRGPWEGLRVNHKRGLLVATHAASNGIADQPGQSPFDVYRVKKDCTKPKLLFTGIMPTATGHEGWFSPDGKVFYASSFIAVSSLANSLTGDYFSNSNIVPIDVSNPRKPRELAVWPLVAHGGSVSDDGQIGYFCDFRESFTDNFIAVVDISEADRRVQGADYKVLSRLELPGGATCQETQPISYGGRPHLLQFSELPANAFGECPSEVSNFGRPNIIDVSNPRRPILVSSLMNEIAQPENCTALLGDKAPMTNPNAAAVAVNLYGTHMCTPDRLHDPTLLACTEFRSGLRVYNIRDPRNPREIAYFNTGTLSPTDPTVDMAASRPVIKPKLGQIWTNTLVEGFYTLQLDPDIYSHKRLNRCRTKGDWFVPHYNSGVPVC